MSYVDASSSRPRAISRICLSCSRRVSSIDTNPLPLNLFPEDVASIEDSVRDQHDRAIEQFLDATCKSKVSGDCGVVIVAEIDNEHDTGSTWRDNFRRYGVQEP